MLPLSLRARRINWRFRFWFDPAHGGIVEWSIFVIVFGAMIAAGLYAIA